MAYGRRRSPQINKQALPDMPQYEFHLSISPEKYLAYYGGNAKKVVVRCVDGLVIQFPASLLQQYILQDGINGDFMLTTDANNKGANLQRRAER
jgi:hypothetical protein